MTDDTLVQHVSDTAFWVAYFRAEESTRPDAIFRDPLASRLAGDRGSRIAAGFKESPWVRWNVVVRTHIIDEYIQQAVAGGIDAVLNLGAGLDTRPYRMKLPSHVRWFEADFPEVIAFKDEKLKDERPAVVLERLRADLASAHERERVLNHVAALGKKILVLTEGVTPYLSPEDVSALGRDLARYPGVCFWVTDYHSPLFEKMYKDQKVLSGLKAKSPFRFFPGDWDNFFRNCGWQLKTMRYIHDVAMQLKRPPPLPLFIRLLTSFMPKAKKEEFRTMNGFALLEKT